MTDPTVTDPDEYRVVFENERAASESRDVRLSPGELRWPDGQTHSGENIGTTPTHVVFVPGATLGPA